MPLYLGPDWQSELWASEYSLRFELSQGGAHINMFTSGFDRARQLTRAALSSRNLTGIVAANPDPTNVMGAEALCWMDGTGFDHIEEMGVSTKNPIAEWSGYFWPDDKLDEEARPWVHRAVKLDWEQADILIWNQVAADMGVTPLAAVQSKIVDLEAGLEVFVYDDRGMDVSALTKESLIRLYREYNDWLLDYDRPRMARVFED